MSESVSDIEFELSSGNVFADLGFENAEEMLAKADLVIDIYSVMEERGIGDAEVAAVLGIPPAEVPFLLRGDFEDISVETLQRGLETLQQKGKKGLRRQPGSGYSGGQSGGAGGGEPLAAAGRE